MRYKDINIKEIRNFIIKTISNITKILIVVIGCIAFAFMIMNATKQAKAEEITTQSTTIQDSLQTYARVYSGGIMSGYQPYQIETVVKNPTHQANTTTSLYKDVVISMPYRIYYNGSQTLFYIDGFSIRQTNQTGVTPPGYSPSYAKTLGSTTTQAFTSYTFGNPITITNTSQTIVFRCQDIVSLMNCYVFIQVDLENELIYQYKEEYNRNNSIDMSNHIRYNLNDSSFINISTSVQKEEFLYYTNRYYAIGSSPSYDIGFQDGYEKAKTEVRQQAYNEGYNKGREDYDSQPLFRELILSICEYPINLFKTIFDFEIFGVNISAVVLSALSLLIVAYCFKRLL